MTNLLRVVTVLLGATAGAAHAAHLPSPCSTGEVGEGSNCMYLVSEFANYNSATGHRMIPGSSSTLEIEVWIDFNQMAVQGGGFDILFDTSYFASYTWVWNDPEFTAGEQTLDGTATANGWEGIQFDDFQGNGFGGTTGTQNGFALVGTLFLNVQTFTDNVVFSIAQPYTDATFPNCFAPGAFSGGSGCVPTDFYNLQVAIPLPAAAWLLLCGLISLAGFRRGQVCPLLT